MGIAVFLFFLIKGLCWLALLVVPVLWTLAFSRSLP
jgi:hypothetical protein